MGVRCADALKSIETEYVVFCADDDFVIPAALRQSVQYLVDHPDFSVALGRVYSLTYLKEKAFFRRGLMIDNPLGVIGFMGHQKFLQRSMYYFAYTILGSIPLFYGVKRTEVAREAFYAVPDSMKYSGMELLSVSICLLRGKIHVANENFGFRDYSCPTFDEPLRHDPETYQSPQDLDYIRSLLTGKLAAAESLSLDDAQQQVDMHLSQWPTYGWTPLGANHRPFGFAQKARMALRLLYSMIFPARVGQNFEVPRDVAKALAKAHAGFLKP